MSWCKCPGVPRDQPPGMAAVKCITDDGCCSSETCFVNSKLCASTSKILYYTYSARCKLKNFKKWLYYINKWLWVYRRSSKFSAFAKEYNSLFSFAESPLSVSLWRDKLKALRFVTKACNLRKQSIFGRFFTKSYIPTVKCWLFIFKIAVLDQLRALFNNTFLQPTLAFTASTECTEFVAFE